MDLQLNDGPAEEADSPVQSGESASSLNDDVATPMQGNRAPRTTEREVQAAILDLMQDGNVWTNAGLKAAIPALLALTAADREMSMTRPEEDKWEELVNNALSEQGRSNSLYAQGFVTKVGHGQHRLKSEQLPLV